MAKIAFSLYMRDGNYIQSEGENLIAALHNAGVVMFAELAHGRPSPDQEDYWIDGRWMPIPTLLEKTIECAAHALMIGYEEAEDTPHVAVLEPVLAKLFAARGQEYRPAIYPRLVQHLKKLGFEVTTQPIMWNGELQNAHVLSRAIDWQDLATIEFDPEYAMQNAQDYCEAAANAKTLRGQPDEDSAD